MTNSRMLAVAGTVWVVLVATGCDAGGEPSPPPSRPAAPPSASAAVSDATFRIVRTVPRADAVESLPAGQPQRVLDLVGKDKRGYTTGPLAVTASGEMVAAKSPPAKTGDGDAEVRIGQCRVGLVNGTGFHPFPAVAGDGGPPRQAAGAAERDGVVVWAETTSTDLYFFDWRVYAYDPAARKTRLLGDSGAMAPKARLPLGPGNGEPVIGDRAAFWSTTYPTTDDRKFGMRVMTRTLTGGGAMEVAVDQAKFPAAAGADLYYVRSEDVAPGFDSGRYEIRRRAAAGADQLVAAGALGPEQMVSKLVAGDDRLAWVVASPADDTSTLYLWTASTNEAVAFPMDHAAPWTMFVSLTPSLLAWSNGSASGDAGQYVYELAGQRLWRLGTVDGLSIIHGKDNAIAWSELSADNVSSFHAAKWKLG